MRDRIYVGRLISEEALAHSAGPWKKHKYLKKIGDRYYYTKEALANATKKAGKKVGDIAYDARFEAEWQAGKAANAIGKAKDAVVDTVDHATGLDFKKDYNRNKAKEQMHREEAAYYQRKADNLNKVAVREYGFLDPKKDLDRAMMKSTSDSRSMAISEQRYHLGRAAKYQNRATNAKRAYATTPFGKVENAGKILKGRSERAKKRLEQALKRVRKKKK